MRWSWNSVHVKQRTWEIINFVIKNIIFRLQAIRKPETKLFYLINLLSPLPLGITSKFIRRIFRIARSISCIWNDCEIYIFVVFSGPASWNYFVIFYISVVLLICHLILFLKIALMAECRCDFLDYVNINTGC